MSEIVKLTISTVIRPAVPPPTDLDELTDVNTEGAVAGQVLKYDGEKWVPGADEEGNGGGSTTVVDDLTSTSTTSALSANQGRVLKQQVDSKADTSSLAPVATSGAYSDLTGRPTYTTAASLPADLSGYVNGSEIVVTG